MRIASTFIRVRFLSALLLAIIAFDVGCHGSGSGIGHGDRSGVADTIAPLVQSIFPGDGASSVPLDRVLQVVFSEAMDPTTVTGASFTLSSGGIPVSGTVAVAGNAATFTPLVLLTASTSYTATVTVEAKDLAGNPLPVAKTWTFTSGLTTDVTAPTVTSTLPTDLAPAAPINSSIVINFSEAMDPLSLDLSSVLLSAGGGNVAGSLSFAGTSVIFTPSLPLASSTLYTGTVTVGARDLAGNPLAADHVWTFTTAATADVTPPTVTSTIPADGAPEVALNSSVSATFSEPMDPLTLSLSSFFVDGGSGNIPGSLEYSGSSVTFTPSMPLSSSTTYTATITVAAEDLAGNSLALEKVWTFQTSATLDITPPQVISTDPADLETDTPVNGNITATFDEQMDPGSINDTTFLVVQGMSAVPGVVTYLGTSAIFDPISDLGSNLNYEARITTGATDSAGNTLAGDEVWTFTTGMSPAQGPPPVVLGTAGNFVLLGKSTITLAGLTSIVGDVGLSPSAQSLFTGFSEALDGSNQFATSPFVTGRMYAADMATPTPADMSTAISDMEIAFVDAAGRTSPDTTEEGAGDITGLNLVPGLRKWGTEVSINGAGVTLTGGSNDVWIFQIAQDLTVASGAIVTLAGGARPENIFWQVEGQVTLGTGADFKGILISKTQIVMQTGAIFKGRALAQTAITMDANDVSAP